MKRRDLHPGEEFTYVADGPDVVFVVDAPAAGRPLPKQGRSTDSTAVLDGDVHIVWSPCGRHSPPPVPAAPPKPVLTTDKKARKEQPIARGVLAYFPRAMAAVANVSFVGNEQHNPGQPMHWAKGKSNDHADCIVRHLIEAGTVDEDGLRHTAKAAWRALALLETELEALDAK